MSGAICYRMGYIAGEKEEEKRHFSDKMSRNG
jgi:hypothetical protein